MRVCLKLLNRCKLLFFAALPLSFDTSTSKEGTEGPYRAVLNEALYGVFRISGITWMSMYS